jgi:hypothetical protein
MTEYERTFAEENYMLVYRFLRASGLPEDEYYDIVIFGYLQAVQEYCAVKETQKYQFSTVAWRKMDCAVKDHRRYLESKKRSAFTVSIHDPVSEGSTRKWEDILHDDCNALKKLQAEMVLHSLALTPKERRITKMRQKGETMHSISKTEHMTFQQINSVLEKIRKYFIKALFILIWRLQ